MKRILNIILIVGVGIYLLSACKKEKEPIVLNSNLKYVDIKAIFDKNGCTGCHGSTVSDYNKVLSEWVDITVNPKSTVLYNAIKTGGAMNGYIGTPSDIDNILEWITNDAPGETTIPTGGGGTDTVYLDLPEFVSYDETIKPILSNCVGCHHDEEQIIYENLFTINSSNIKWIDTSLSYKETALYIHSKPGGDMSEFLDSYQRNMVFQWMSYGAIKNN